MVTEKDPDGLTEGGFFTPDIVNLSVCAGMFELEEFIDDINMLFVELSYAQVGLDLTDVPTSVAQPVVTVKVTVVGNTILTIPYGDNPSVIVILIPYVVTLFTVESVGNTVPVKVEETACIVALPVILSNPFLIIFTVMLLVVFVEGGAFIW